MDDTAALLALPRAHRTADVRARLGSRALDTLVETGDLTRLARGIVAPTAHADSLQTRASAAALLTAGTGVATGTGALFLWRAVARAPASLLVGVPRERHDLRRLDGVRFTRLSTMPQTFSFVAFSVAPPEEALIHAMRERREGTPSATALEALSSGMLDIARVRELLDARPSLSGRRHLVRALALHDSGIESHLEHLAIDSVLVGDEFASLVRQHAISVGGASFRLDAYLPEHRLAIEFDGATEHAKPARWRKDRARDTLLASIGIQTIRLTYKDVTERPEWSRTRLLEAMAHRSPMPRVA